MAVGSQRQSQVSQHKPLAGCVVTTEPRTRKEAAGQAGGWRRVKNPVPVALRVGCLWDVQGETDIWMSELRGQA